MIDLYDALSILPYLLILFLLVQRIKWLTLVAWSKRIQNSNIKKCFLSFCPKSTCTYGMVVTDIGYNEISTRTLRLHNWASTLQNEQVGILVALEYIYHQNINALIVCDSKSALLR